MHPNASGLDGLSIGSLTLSPAFSSDVTTYTATTTNASNKVTATLKDSADALEIKVNGTEIQNGTSASWNVGDNTLAVCVTDSDTGTETKYTITVTRSE